MRPKWSDAPRLGRLEPLAEGLNAFTCRFDPGLLDEIRESYRQDLEAFLAHPEQQYLFEGGRYHALGIGVPESPYYLVTYDTFPLLWLSNNTARTFALFRRFFDRLGITADLRQLVDFRRQIVMYSGFFVIGNRAEEEMWHFDYRPGANAYTLITPLFALASGHGQLLYKDRDGQSRSYHYRLGEAIVFGEGFLHSTEPYQPVAEPRVLVSMTFGTDKWDYWEILSQNIQEQSNYFIQPCGHVAGSCGCHRRWQRWRRIRDFFRA
ncbi:MAG: hypothetical protein ACAI44_03315 [Candidatus Sericytochromatia bacterium]